MRQRQRSPLLSSMPYNSSFPARGCLWVEWRLYFTILQRKTSSSCFSFHFNFTGCSSCSANNPLNRIHNFVSAVCSVPASAVWWETGELKSLIVSVEAPCFISELVLFFFLMDTVKANSCATSTHYELNRSCRRKNIAIYFKLVYVYAIIYKLPIS